MRNKTLAIVVVILMVIILGYGFVNTLNDYNTISSPISSIQEQENPVFENIEELQETNDNIKTLKDGTKYIVDPKLIRSGGPPKDGIPPIDNPVYISVDEADEWIDDNELVLAIIYKDVKRVYPLQIMTFHEIVNDFIADDPILITYCPLCGSGIAYERKINNETVEFGTSGKLYNSNLVMYDRLTDSYWSQIDGKAIVGELTGLELTEISIDTTTWEEWIKEHPDSEVLSRDTGHIRPYGRDPYLAIGISYRLFPSAEDEDKLLAKSVVFGIEVNGTYKAYKEFDLKNLGVIKDNVNNVNIKIERDNAGIVIVTNLDTGKEIVKERDFWFAWLAFHPETLIYEKE